MPWSRERSLLAFLDDVYCVSNCHCCTHAGVTVVATAMHTHAGIAPNLGKTRVCHNTGLLNGACGFCSASHSVAFQLHWLRCCWVSPSPPNRPLLTTGRSLRTSLKTALPPVFCVDARAFARARVGCSCTCTATFQAWKKERVERALVASTRRLPLPSMHKLLVVRTCPSRWQENPGRAGGPRTAI